MGQCQSVLYTPPPYAEETLQEAINKGDEEYITILYNQLSKNIHFRKHKIVRDEIISVLAKSVITSSYKKEKDLTAIDNLLFKCMVEIAKEKPNAIMLCENEIKLIKKLVDNITYRKDSVQTLSCIIIAMISSHDCAKLAHTTLQNHLYPTAKKNNKIPRENWGELEIAIAEIVGNLVAWHDEQKKLGMANELLNDDDDEEEDIIIIGQNKSNANVINKLNEINVENRTKQLLLATGDVDIASLTSPGKPMGGGLLTQAYQRISPNNSPSQYDGQHNNENMSPNLNGALSPFTKTPGRRMSNSKPLVGLVPTSMTQASEKPLKPVKPTRGSTATPAKSQQHDTVYSTPAVAQRPAGPMGGMGAVFASLQSRQCPASDDSDSDDDSPIDARAAINAMLLRNAGGGGGGGTSTQQGSAGRVTYAEHPVYSKYFRMLRVGAPLPGIHKTMREDGIELSILDNAPTDLVPADQGGASSTTGGGVQYQDHPLYKRFFVMLKVGTDIEYIRLQMRQANLDDSIIDRRPDEIVVEVPAEEMCALKDHPAYEKYFKMVRFGQPKDAVQHKMRMDGENENVLEFEPTRQVPKHRKMEKSPPKTNRRKSVSKSTVKKKKFYWNSVDESRIGDDSLWAEPADEFDPKILDQTEFNELFVEDLTKKRVAVASPLDEAKHRRAAGLLDPKRAQAGNIALARIKIPPEQIRASVEAWSDAGFTPDQVQYLYDFIPTPEEAMALLSYQGDAAALDTVEKYMLAMAAVTSAKGKLQCLLMKQTHKSRLSEIRKNATAIQKACDDVKLSIRLKKVLKTILRVGNQMNDAEKVGFSVDSLLKLRDTKALDQKTSLLYYVISIVHKNDASSLQFAEDLRSIADATRLPLDSIYSDYLGYKKEFEATYTLFNKQLKEELGNQGLTEQYQNTLQTLDAFFEKAKQDVLDLGTLCGAAKEKYCGVLSYFGEDPNLLSEEFFSTLHAFIIEFNTTKNLFEKTKIESEKKKARESADLTKRASMIIPSSAKKSSPLKAKLTRPSEPPSTESKAYKHYSNRL